MMRRGPFAHTRLRWVALASAAVLLGLLTWKSRTTQVATPPTAPALERAVSATAAGASGAMAEAVTPAPAPAARREPRPILASTVAPPATPGAKAVAPGSAGMVVAIDPETGQLGMPTPGQMRALAPAEAAALNLSDQGLVEFAGPEGAVGINVNGRFQAYYVVRIGPDGKKIVTCVDDPVALKKALEQPQPAPSRLEEE